MTIKEQIELKWIELVDLYKQLVTNGRYLSAVYVKGKIMMNNEYWKGEEEPIDIGIADYDKEKERLEALKTNSDWVRGLCDEDLAMLLNVVDNCDMCVGKCEGVDSCLNGGINWLVSTDHSEAEKAIRYFERKFNEAKK